MQLNDQDKFYWFYYKLILWLYGFMLKLVPCLVLTVFTASLIRALYQAEENSNKAVTSSNPAY